MWQRQKRPSTLQTVDVESRRLQRYLSEFWDVYRVIGRSTMTTPISIVGETSVFAYRRGNKSFSEEQAPPKTLCRESSGSRSSDRQQYSSLGDSRSALTCRFCHKPNHRGVSERTCRSTPAEVDVMRGPRPISF